MKPPIIQVRHVPGYPGDAELSMTQILDATFGNIAGLMLYRGTSTWGVVSPSASFAVATNQLYPNVRSVVVPLVGVVATTGGAIASWQPPEGGPVVVTRCVVVVTTGATGAANLSVGVAANATTSATNLITATSCHTSAVIIDSITNQITAVAPVALYMSATSAVTFTGSADTSGLVGSALIEYWKP